MSPLGMDSPIDWLFRRKYKELCIKLLIFMVIYLIYPGMAVAADKLHYKGLIELQLATSDSNQSSFSGGVGKSRYDDDSYPIQIGKLGLHLDYHITDSLWLRTMTTLYADDGIEPALNEVFLNYRPVPKGPMRMRAKLGAFHLPISLENKVKGKQEAVTIYTPTTKQTF